MTRAPPSDLIWAEVAAQTHVFQNIRPLNPYANAICHRCGLALPHGAILAIGPGSLPPCGGAPSVQDA
jgi:hypothetical protein